MATSKDKSTGPETVKLVGPDGEQEREVVVGSEGETKARWEGFLPAEQAKLEAPEPPTPTGPKTVGTNGSEV